MVQSTLKGFYLSNQQKIQGLATLEGLLVEDFVLMECTEAQAHNPIWQTHKS